jgi:hypothetical protein
MPDLPGIYLRECERLCCHPNSAVLQMLKMNTENTDSLTTLDLRRNFAGPVGCLALLPVAVEMPQLQVIDFEGNQLTNTFVDALAELLMRRTDGCSSLSSAAPMESLRKTTDCSSSSTFLLPSLAYLNLSRNIITRAGGKKLLLAVSVRRAQAPAMPPIKIVLEDTFVNQYIIDRIDALATITASSDTDEAKSVEEKVTHSEESVADSRCRTLLPRGSGADLLYQLLVSDLVDAVRRGELDSLALLFADRDENILEFLPSQRQCKERECSRRLAAEQW